MQASKLTSANMGLISSFKARAESIGKLDEANTFVARIMQECPNNDILELAMLGAWLDGLRFGNWPWVRP